MPSITKDTKVSLATVGSILTVGAAIIWQLATIKTVFTNEINELKDHVTQIEEDNYSMPMAVESAFRLAMRNPGMIVPDPRDPSKTIRVDSVEIQE